MKNIIKDKSNKNSFKLKSPVIDRSPKKSDVEMEVKSNINLVEKLISGIQ